MERKIMFVCNAIKWFDKVNGNTYHSVKITRCKDNKVIVGAFQYGYGNHYQQTALEEMQKAGFLPKKYNDKKEIWNYERENNYPISWNVTNGLKRDCIDNGKIKID